MKSKQNAKSRKHKKKSKNILFSLLSGRKVKKILADNNLTPNQYHEFKRLVMLYENKLNNSLLEIKQAENLLIERKSSLELLKMKKKEGKLQEATDGTLLGVKHDLSRRNIERILKPLKENLKMLRKKHREMVKDTSRQLENYLKIVKLQTEILPFNENYQ